MGCLLSWLGEMFLTQYNMKRDCLNGKGSHGVTNEGWIYPALYEKHYRSVIAPVALFTLIGTLVRGVFVGPWTTDAAFAGSNSAPWQGHNRC